MYSSLSLSLSVVDGITASATLRLYVWISSHVMRLRLLEGVPARSKKYLTEHVIVSRPYPAPERRPKISDVMCAAVKLMSIARTLNVELIARLRQPVKRIKEVRHPVNVVVHL